MHASPAINLWHQRPRTIKLRSAFTAISVTLMLLLVLVGQPQWGVTIAAPWLSVALVQRPALLFAAYIYIPFYKSVIQDYTPIDATVWLAVLSMIALIVHSSHRKMVRLPLVFLFWLAFAITLIGGTVWSIDLEHSFTTFVTTFALTMLPLLLVIVVAGDRELISSFLRITLNGSVIFSAVGVISLFFLDGQRLELTSNTIGSGRIAMMGLLIAPAVVAPGKRKPFIVAAIIGLTFVATLATGSRGPLLAGAVSLLAIYGIWTKWIAIRVLGFVIAAFVGVGILFSSWIEEIVPMSSVGRVRSLIEAVFGQGDLDGSSMTRVRLMAHAIDMWSERPFIGWGLGSFGIVESNSSLGANTYPHNLFLQFGAELGMIGFAVVSLMVVWVFVRLYSGLKDPSVTAVAILTMFAFVSAQLSNNIYDNRWLWGMLLLGGAMEIHRGTWRQRNGAMASESDSINVLPR